MRLLPRPVVTFPSVRSEPAIAAPCTMGSPVRFPARANAASQFSAPAGPAVTARTNQSPDGPEAVDWTDPPTRSEAARATPSRKRVTRTPEAYDRCSLKRHVAVLALRQVFALGAQHLQSPDQHDAGVGGVD